MIRPSVGLPTGTLIGLPVFLTTVPRRRPSDAPRQMVREFHVDHRADALYDLAFYQSSSTHRFSFRYSILHSRKGAVSMESPRPVAWTVRLTGARKATR
jgi:hypothetical protein